MRPTIAKRNLLYSFVSNCRYHATATSVLNVNYQQPQSELQPHSQSQVNLQTQDTVRPIQAFIDQNARISGQNNLHSSISFTTNNITASYRTRLTRFR